MHVDKFEEGMSKGGQTRTHALLAYAFGVRSVVVAITQLDTLVIPYSRKRYDSCQSEVLRYLKRVGFVQDRVSCVPVSGLCGDNISEVSTNLSWCASAADFLHVFVRLTGACLAHATGASTASIPTVLTFPRS